MMGRVVLVNFSSACRYNTIVILQAKSVESPGFFHCGLSRFNWSIFLLEKNQQEHGPLWKDRKEGNGASKPGQCHTHPT
jgi:hypothetical protein